MRKRINERGMDSEDRIEEMGEANTMRLRYKPEQRPVPIEAPRPSSLNYLEPGFVASI
jgi:hypothetical protein